MSDPRDHAVVEVSPFAHIDHPEKFAFLECFRDNCNVRKSCDLARIDAGMTRRRKRGEETDAQFRRRLRVEGRILRGELAKLIRSGDLPDRTGTGPARTRRR